MALMTKLQRNYITDIETNLNVTFDGDNTRRDADIFIKKHAEKNREFKLSNNKQIPPTGKQRRFIEDIEDILDVKYTGRTVKSASKFIALHLTEYRAKIDTKRKIKRYYNKVADGIDAYQKRRREG